MNIFVSAERCFTDKLSALNPVLAFHWANLSVPERAAGISNPASPFTLVNQPEQADLFLLTYEWHRYVHRMQEAQREAQLAQQYGKKILVWHSGDLPPIIPFSNAMTWQAALYASRLQAHQHAAPYFAEDPLPRFNHGQLTLREKSEKPVVGFCGFAGLSALKFAYGLYATLKHNLSSKLGKSSYEAIPWLPATVTRNKALKNLQANAEITTNFQINTRAFKQNDQRVSVETKAAQNAAFYRNILESDYTVCIRGFGNWSMRFYETLACGRIPIFVNTDCVLPLTDIDWKSYCVWVEHTELARIDKLVLQFHQQMSASDFTAKQVACRTLWETKLSQPGFMKHLAEELKSLL